MPQKDHFHREFKQEVEKLGLTDVQLTWKKKSVQVTGMFGDRKITSYCAKTPSDWRSLVQAVGRVKAFMRHGNPRTEFKK